MASRLRQRAMSGEPADALGRILAVCHLPPNGSNGAGFGGEEGSKKAHDR